MSEHSDLLNIYLSTNGTLSDFEKILLLNTGIFSCVDSNTKKIRFLKGFTVVDDLFSGLGDIDNTTFLRNYLVINKEGAFVSGLQGFDSVSVKFSYFDTFWITENISLFEHLIDYCDVFHCTGSLLTPNVNPNHLPHPCVFSLNAIQKFCASIKPDAIMKPDSTVLITGLLKNGVSVSFYELFETVMNANTYMDVVKLYQCSPKYKERFILFCKFLFMRDKLYTSQIFRNGFFRFHEEDNISVIVDNIHEYYKFSASLIPVDTLFKTPKSAFYYFNHIILSLYTLCNRVKFEDVTLSFEERWNFLTAVVRLLYVFIKKLKVVLPDTSDYTTKKVFHKFVNDYYDIEKILKSKKELFTIFSQNEGDVGQFYGMTLDLYLVILIVFKMFMKLKSSSQVSGLETLYNDVENEILSDMLEGCYGDIVDFNSFAINANLSGIYDIPMSYIINKGTVGYNLDINGFSFHPGVLMKTSDFIKVFSIDENLIDSSILDYVYVFVRGIFQENNDFLQFKCASNLTSLLLTNNKELGIFDHTVLETKKQVLFVPWTFCRDLRKSEFLSRYFKEVYNEVVV